MFALTAYHFNPFALPNVATAAGVLLWGLLLRWRESDSTTGVWALRLSIAAATWQLGFAAVYCSSDGATAAQWIVVSQFGVIFLAPGLYELLRRLLGLRGWRNRLSPWIWATSIGFVCVLLFTDSYLGEPYRYWWGYYAHYRIGGTLLAAFLCVTMFLLFIQCVHTWRLSPRGSSRRHRARALVVGFGVCFTAAIDFLAAWGFEVYPFGYLMLLFMILTIGYAAWRYRIVSVTSQAAAEHVLATLSDGVLVLDELGAIALANSRALRLLGRNRDEVVGRTIQEVIPRAEEVATPSPERSLRPRHTEIDLPGDDGEKRVINLTVSRMSDAGGGSPLTVLVMQDVTRYRDAVDRIRKLVYYDQTTGLANRRHFCERLDRALSLAGPGQHVAVCGIRLKHVRRLANNAPTHSAEPLLNDIATRLRSFADSVPGAKVTVARLQGYEFAALFERAESIGQITSALDRLRRMLREPLSFGNRQLRPEPWLGVGLYPTDGDNAGALMDRAAAAVDEAAEIGDGFVHFYNDEANAAALHSLTLGTQLVRAIETDALCLHFQPVVSSDSGTIESAEALVRWRDPRHGLRLPSEFIPVAEQSGSIVALDEWVIRNACEHALRWRGQAGSRVPRVAVNISGAHLASSEGVRIDRTIRAILENSGLPPERLEIEITETRLVGTDPTVVESLRRLRELGIRIAVDDFGIGYASLSYLQSFPLDKLKIDQSFISAIGQDEKKTTLLETILLMASQLGLEVVAEGVETPHQAAFLLRHRCDFMQGYLFSRPVAADEFAHLVRSWSVPGGLPIPFGRERAKSTAREKATPLSFPRTHGEPARN